MKVIFLDIDGVLNCETTTERVDGLFFVEDRKLELLKRIIDSTGAKCVLSSTWRSGWNGNNSFNPMCPEVKALFDKCKEFEIEIIDKTGKEGFNRGEQINAWLTVRDDVEEFIILDDDCDMHPLMDKLVKTTWKHGLTEDIANECIDRLNGGVSNDGNRTNQVNS